MSKNINGKFPKKKKMKKKIETILNRGNIIILEDEDSESEKHKNIIQQSKPSEITEKSAKLKIPKKTLCESSIQNSSQPKYHVYKAVRSHETSKSDYNMIDTISFILSSKEHSIPNVGEAFSNNISENVKEGMNSLKLHPPINDVNSSSANKVDCKAKKKLKRINKNVKKSAFKRNEFIDRNVPNGNNNFYSNSLPKMKKKKFCSINLPATYMSASLKSITPRIPQILLNSNMNTYYSREDEINYHHSILELFDRTSRNQDVSFHTINENRWNDEYISENTAMYSNNNIENADNFASQQLSTYNNQKALHFEELPTENDSFELYEESNYCLLHLKRLPKVYFCGVLRASLLYGKVEILGCELNEECHDIYSVNGYGLLAFEALPHVNNLQKLRQRLITQNISMPTIQKIFNDIRSSDSLLIVRPLKSVMTEFISKHFLKFNLFSSIRITFETGSHFSSLLLSDFFAGSCSDAFVKNETWDSLLNSVIFRMDHGLSNKVFLCGGKNAGKSTMMRYISNRLLKFGPVLIIDLDPGQAEFTISGLVSATIIDKPLLGPNFTHLRPPIRSYSIGLTNVVENIDRYINAITQLADFLNESNEYSKMPCIINTMGFTEGIGLKLLIESLNLFRPTAVVEIKSEIVKNNFPMEITCENVHTFQNDNVDPELCENIVPQNYEYYMCSPYQEMWRNIDKNFTPRNINPSDERLLNVLSYFSEMTSLQSSSLLKVPPRIVSLKTIGIAVNSMIVQDKYLLNVLNGRLIALCVDNNNINDKNTPNVCSLLSTSVMCLGYAIVRGVDVVDEQLYILTPLSDGILNQVNILFYSEALPDCSGEFSIPNLPNTTMIPYTTITSYRNLKHKNLHQIPKRRFNTGRFFEMARKKASVKL